MAIIYNGTYCVYAHINKINGKIYIGQTIHGDNPSKQFEKLLIEKLNTTDKNFGYNITTGGKSYTMSDETKKKISESSKGKIISDEAKIKLSISVKKAWDNDEMRKKASERNTKKK